MTEAILVVSRRSETRRAQTTRQQPRADEPRRWRNPSPRRRAIFVAIVYAPFGFLAGALVGAFFGWFLVPACLGAVAAAAGGAWLESRA